MEGTWSPDELERIQAADGLEIAVKRADGTLRRWVPIWVVCVDEQVYVRTWHRRDTGWLGVVSRSRRARIRVPGVDIGVAVEDIGEGAPGLRSEIDASYRSEYRRYGHRSIDDMVAPVATATTLRLEPDRGDEPGAPE